MSNEVDFFCTTALQRGEPCVTRSPAEQEGRGELCFDHDLNTSQVVRAFRRFSHQHTEKPPDFRLARFFRFRARKHHHIMGCQSSSVLDTTASVKQPSTPPPQLTSPTAAGGRSVGHGGGGGGAGISPHQHGAMVLLSPSKGGPIAEVSANQISLSVMMDNGPLTARHDAIVQSIVGHRRKSAPNPKLVCCFRRCEILVAGWW